LWPCCLIPDLLKWKQTVYRTNSNTAACCEAIKRNYCADRDIPASGQTDLIAPIFFILAATYSATDYFAFAAQMPQLLVFTSIVIIAVRRA
jgi:hypothetical protein